MIFSTCLYAESDSSVPIMDNASLKYGKPWMQVKSNSVLLNGLTDYDSIFKDPPMNKNLGRSGDIKIDSKCEASCDTRRPNCSWGPLTEEAIQEKFSRCPNIIDRRNELVVYREESLKVRCQIGGKVSATDTMLSSLGSIKDLITYDCSVMKAYDDGDGAFCHCILNKAGKEKSSYFSPLTQSEITDLNRLVEADHYKKEIRSLKEGFLRASKILQAGFFANENLQKLIDDTGLGKACIAGGFKQLEELIGAELSDSKAVCGKSGMRKMSLLNKMNNKDKECDKLRKSDCALEGNNGREAKSSDSFFEQINNESISNLKTVHGEELAVILKKEGLNLTQVIDSCKSQSGSILEKGTPLYNSICGNVPKVLPASSYNYQGSISAMLQEYRAYKKLDNPDLASFLNKESSKKLNIKSLLKDISADFPVIRLGVLDNHADQLSPEAKLIELLDFMIPEEDGTQQGRSAQVIEGLNNIQRYLTGQAMGRCGSFIKKSAEVCRELDGHGINAELSIGDYKLMNTKEVAALIKDRNLIGETLEKKTEYELGLKLDQLRCINIVSDKKMASRGFLNEDILHILYRDHIAGKGNLNILNDEKYPSGSAVDEGTSFLIKADSFFSKGSVVNENANRPGSLGLVELNGLASSDKLEEATVEPGRLQDAERLSKGFVDETQNSDVYNNTEGSQSFMENSYVSKNKNQPIADKQEEKLIKEEDKNQKQLDVITEQLRSLMAASKSNSDKLDKKESESDKDKRSRDPEYQRMLMEKINLERQIAGLSSEKKEKLEAKQEFEQQLATIEEGRKEKAKQSAIASKLAARSEAVSSSKDSGVREASRGASISRSRGASGLGGSARSSSGKSVSSGVDDQNFYKASPHIITLSQDQVTEIKNNFQLIKDTKSWKSDGKPPVIRDGNIFYELVVKDGKILYENGKPVRKQALNGLNQAAPSRGVASVKNRPDEAKESLATAKSRRAARVKELNSVLDAK